VPSTSSAAASEATGGGSGPALSPNSGYHYQRREVERSTLYALVRDHLETFYQAVEEGFASAPLPNFVKQEFERFLDCGVLCRGAALLVCETCSQTNVIALSCKGRGFCPSCLGRRMAQSSANIIDHILPRGVPLRQWVLTCPFQLRARLGFDAALLGELSAAVNGCLLDFYERALRPRVAALPIRDGKPGRRPKLHSGTITVVQRVSSDLRLNSPS
jgi:transposase-like zinc-binding protein